MSKQLININGRLLDLTQPKIMAIVNATPDSFYSGSRLGDKSAVKYVQSLIDDGADIIDIGACSTRPGSHPPSEQEEWQRLEPVLREIRSAFPDTILSVDTFRKEIARRAVISYGVGIINDISGGQADSGMFNVVAELGIPYVLTHNSPDHANSMAEVIELLRARVQALQNMGAKDIIIDPGFGFNKTLDQNWNIMANLRDLEVFELPILVGLSRKSMLTKLLDISANEALNATTAAHILSLQGGANILRVHDAKEAKQAITIYNKITISK